MGWGASDDITAMLVAWSKGDESAPARASSCGWLLRAVRRRGSSA